jgi:hypothetical protein
LIVLRSQSLIQGKELRPPRPTLSIRRSISASILECAPYIPPVCPINTPWILYHHIRPPDLPFDPHLMPAWILHPSIEARIGIASEFHQMHPRTMLVFGTDQSCGINNIAYGYAVLSNNVLTLRATAPRLHGHLLTCGVELLDVSASWPSAESACNLPDGTSATGNRRICVRKQA